MPTAPELAISLIRRAVDDLSRIVALTPPDKQLWSPLDQGRSVLDQLVEVAWTTDIGARTLEARAPVKLAPDELTCRKAEWDTVERAMAAVEKSVARLIGAAGALSADVWESSIVLPMRDGEPVSYVELVMMHYWHLTYHYAQIAYIQTLYGDRESW